MQHRTYYTILNCGLPYLFDFIIWNRLYGIMYTFMCILLMILMVIWRRRGIVMSTEDGLVYTQSLWDFGIPPSHSLFPLRWDFAEERNVFDTLTQRTYVQHKLSIFMLYGYGVSERSENDVVRNRKLNDKFKCGSILMETKSNFGASQIIAFNSIAFSTLNYAETHLCISVRCFCINLRVTLLFDWPGTFISFHSVPAILPADKGWFLNILSNFSLLKLSGNSM